MIQTLLAVLLRSERMDGRYSTIGNILPWNSYVRGSGEAWLKLSPTTHRPGRRLGHDRFEFFGTPEEFEEFDPNEVVILA